MEKTPLSELVANSHDGDGVSFDPYELDYGQSDDLSEIRIQSGDDAEHVTVILEYQLSLDWHVIRETADIDGNSPLNDPLTSSLVDGWEEIYWKSEDEWREWFRVMGNIIAERYNGEHLDMAGSVLSWAEVHTAPASLPLDELPKWIWEHSAVVKLINESDPGTYGSQYLFGTIYRDAVEVGE
jgi:hypothetical protein